LRILRLMPVNASAERPTAAPASRPAAWERAKEALGGSYARYVGRRVLWGIAVIVVVALTVFVVARVGSDPARLLLPSDATPEQYRTLKHSLGLDASIPVQLWHYISNLASLNLGTSYWLNAPVTDLIRQRLPNTIELVVVAIAVATLVGITLGVGASLRPGSVLDQGLAAFALIGLSLPQFWLGSMLILLFSVELHWLPTSGMGGLNHLVLPAVTLALPCMGRIAQITRATMIDELSTQHIVVARAKGLSGRYVVVRHALRNVAVPIATLISYESAYALAGYSVVVETVFAWPGVGYLSIQAIEREDLILVQGIVLAIAVIVVALNLVTDLLYKAIDPRIELG
jgi:peptide/nickel transport system permease protein